MLIRILLLALLLLPGVAFAEAAGSIIYVSGTASVVRNGQSMPAVRHGQLQSGDRITTGSDGHVQIRMTDQTLFAIKPDSIFSIDEYRYVRGAAAKPGAASSAGQQEPDWSLSHSFFSLIKGGLREITGLIGQHNHDNTHLKTPVATIGIRGTAFTVTLTKTGDKWKLEVTVLEGAIELGTKFGSLTVTAGESAYVISGQPPQLSMNPTPDSAARAAASSKSTATSGSGGNDNGQDTGEMQVTIQRVPLEGLSDNPSGDSSTDQFTKRTVTPDTPFAGNIPDQVFTLPPPVGGNNPPPPCNCSVPEPGN